MMWRDNTVVERPFPIRLLEAFEADVTSWWRWLPVPRFLPRPRFSRPLSEAQKELVEQKIKSLFSLIFSCLAFRLIIIISDILLIAILITFRKISHPRAVGISTAMRFGWGSLCLKRMFGESCKVTAISLRSNKSWHWVPESFPAHG